MRKMKKNKIFFFQRVRDEEKNKIKMHEKSTRKQRMSKKKKNTSEDTKRLTYLKKL